MEVANHILLSNGMSARSHSHHATVNMPGATVGGAVRMDNSYIINEASGERGDWKQAAGFILDGTRIGEMLSLRQGPARSLRPGQPAERCRVDESSWVVTSISVGGRAYSASGLAIDLHGARIGARLLLDADTASGQSPRIGSRSEKQGGREACYQTI